MIFAVRITDNNQFTKEELTTFTNKHTNLKLVMEYKDYKTYEGKHYHGWIEADLNADTVVKWITRELHCKGNKDYSLSKKEAEKIGLEPYIRYCCKGEEEGTPPIEYYNIETPIVLENHLAFWKARKDYKPTTIKSQLDKIQNYIIEHNMEIETSVDLLQLIIRYFEEEKKLVSNNQLESYYHYFKGQKDNYYSRNRAIQIIQKLINSN